MLKLPRTRAPSPIDRGERFLIGVPPLVMIGAPDVVSVGGAGVVSSSRPVAGSMQRPHGAVPPST